MMAKKHRERIVHEYELERPLMAPEPEAQWWEPGPSDRVDHGGTHGASGVGTRAARHARKPKKRPDRASWTAVIMVLGAVLLIGALTVMLLDIRRGMTGGDPNASRTSTAAERPSGRVLYTDLPSPDTIARRLEKAGYKVDHLEPSYDRTEHGYDVAETKINGTAATILAFPDQATTRDFVNVAGNTRYVIVYGKLWAISFGQSQSLENKKLAEEVAGKLGVQYYWTPEE